MSEKTKGDLPHGCVHLDEVRQTAVFADAMSAWWFNVRHLGWRVTVTARENQIPALYGKLADGGFCDPDKKEAGFLDFRAAWLFSQMMPWWSVDCISLVFDGLEAELYRVDATAVAELLGGE